MNKFVSLLPVIVVSVFSLVQADSLSRERQIEIIENYGYVTGQMAPPVESFATADEDPAERPPVKCGMSALADFFVFRDRLDPELMKALGVQAVDRPTYPGERIYNSPAGLFKLHYTTTGSHAVYRPGEDSDGDGVPNYIEESAKILDNVYDHVIKTLGYDPPPVDSFYPSGGDERYDVYFSNLFPGYMGQTYPDEYADGDPMSIRVTSFMELENDYQGIAAYKSRPLDAVRVTAAHEFFHAVQFGIDFTESELDTANNVEYLRRYWMEMSAVWMEEQVYDGINDYYIYLPYFFEYPRVSIQRHLSDALDYHPYGSVVFPIYLSEKYGPEIIKDIWLRCGDMGGGPHFLAATELAIDSIEGYPDYRGFAMAFREFALWNFFIGQRVCCSPEGVGYSEGLYYPILRDSIFRSIGTSIIDTSHAIVNVTNYPAYVPGNENPYKPEHNSAAYLRLNNLRAIREDTTFWICDNWSNDTCLDSTQVTDTLPGYDIMHVDSVLDMWVSIGRGPLTPADSNPPQPWGLSLVYQFDQWPDSFAVDQTFMPYIDSTYQSSLVRILHPNQYRSVTMIMSTASYYYPAYDSRYYDFRLGYYIDGLLDSTRLDTPIIIDPELVNIPAAVLAPYPNPAVVGEMGQTPLKFKFQIPTDVYSNLVYTKPSYTVDVFNLAGEFVRRMESGTPIHCGKIIEFTTSWDMKNEHEREVASGVYIAMGRVYASSRQRELLVEDRVKVVIIR
ncbi:MAG: MXAN_6640 family putative metalloprotease [bacterium]